MIDQGTQIPGTDTRGQPAAQVIVPYTLDKLRIETQDAVMAWGGDYTFQLLAKNDDYAYARALMGWWETHQDLVVIEHDIVPDPGMIRGLLECPGLWCGHPYHVGDGRYTYGLGLCKISRDVMDYRPGLATLAMRDHRGLVAHVPWASVNEAFERQMARSGYTMHHHPDPVTHLHYPTGQVRGD